MFFRRKVIQSFRYYSKSPGARLYILSAVRTPIGLPNGVLNDFTAPQLLAYAINEALQRAVVPSGDIPKAFLQFSSRSKSDKEIVNRTGLSQAAEISLLSSCALRSFINAAEFLLTDTHTVCMTGGVVSMSNYENEEEEAERKTLKHVLLRQKGLEEFANLDYKNFANGRKNGVFHDEICKIIFRKKGKQILVVEDELAESNENLKDLNEEQSDFEYSPTLADGAIAFVIATQDYIQKNQLMPIAEIISFAEEPVTFNHFPSAQLLAIEKALKVADWQHKDVAQWEIDSAISDMHSSFVRHFSIDTSLVNKDGGVLSLGYPMGLSGAKGLCHLAHSLPFGELGCAASCDLSGAASAVIIKKFHRKISRKPRLTLFTKKPCPLCDDLKDQLRPFEGRFTLNEVDIEEEGNSKHDELYKYEIPVLFLEGRFLCKHKLDAQHFNRRLSELENFARC